MDSCGGRCQRADSELSLVVPEINTQGSKFAPDVFKGIELIMGALPSNTITRWEGRVSTDAFWRVHSVCASPGASAVKHPPAMQEPQETQV